jgi:hypothetical protein
MKDEQTEPEFPFSAGYDQPACFTVKSHFVVDPSKL